MSRRFSKGSHKKASGVTTRLYKAYYMLDGVEVEHNRWAIGNNKEEAQKYWEELYGLKATKLKIR